MWLVAAVMHKVQLCAWHGPVCDVAQGLSPMFSSLECFFQEMCKGHETLAFPREILKKGLKLTPDCDAAKKSMIGWSGHIPDFPIRGSSPSRWI